jgi:hypothetical protein
VAVVHSRWQQREEELQVEVVRQVVVLLLEEEVEVEAEVALLVEEAPQALLDPLLH